jgi:cytochrome c-type biogenesis protein CcmF
MVLVFVGISGQAFNQDVQSDMGVGSKISIGPYTLVCQNFDQVANQNFQSDRATLEVFRNGKSEMMLYPERRFFLASQVTETMVAIRSSALRDLYVVYAGRNPDTGRPVIHAYLNPLVKWIWFGGLIVVLGTLLAMVPNRQPLISLRAVPEISRGTPAGAPVSVLAKGPNLRD